MVNVHDISHYVNTVPSKCTVPSKLYRSNNYVSSEWFPVQIEKLLSMFYGREIKYPTLKKMVQTRTTCVDVTNKKEFTLCKKLPPLPHWCICEPHGMNGHN